MIDRDQTNLETMTKTIGSYEAKTHLPRLLDEVVGGEEITPTKHDVPVAVLVLPTGEERRSAREMIEELKGSARSLPSVEEATGIRFQPSCLVFHAGHDYQITH